jgi:hypothetical protein
MRVGRERCWQCGKKLMRGQHGMIYRTVVLPGGNEVKVHKTCTHSPRAWQRLVPQPADDKGRST